MSFDPTTFVQTSFDDVPDTSPVPCPAGEFTGIIKEAPEIRVVAGKTDPSKVYQFLEVKWIIDDAEVKATMEQDEVVVRQSMSLDVKENGALDMGKGKNWRLGLLLKSVGLLKPGWSLQQLAGQAAKVKVTHRTDKDRPDEIRAEVTATAPLN